MDKTSPRDKAYSAKKYLAKRVVDAKEKIYRAQIALRNWLTDYENALREELGPDHPDHLAVFQEAEQAMIAAEEACAVWKRAEISFNQQYPK